MPGQETELPRGHRTCLHLGGPGRAEHPESETWAVQVRGRKGCGAGRPSGQTLRPPLTPHSPWGRGPAWAPPRSDLPWAGG